MDTDALPRSPLRSAPSTNQEFHRFKESAERLVLRPSMFAPVVMVSFAFVMALLFSPIGVGDEGEMPRGFGYLLLIFMSLFGLASAVAGIAIHRLSTRATFDLVRGELRVRGMRFSEGFRIDLRDVVALQVVSGKPVTSREGTSWRSYELNVAWKKDGEIERVCLLHHCEDKSIRRIAGRIAERTGVPVLDHAADGEGEGAVERSR